MLARVSPEWRGPLDPNGLPTATAMANAAAAFAKDKELNDAPTTFRIEIGSKRIPEVEVAGGELAYHNKMTQGVEALREGFSTPASFSVGKRIYSLNLEKYVAGLSEAGASTRGSEQIQIIAERVGSEQIFAQRMFVTLVFETRINVTVGSVRLTS